MGCYIKYFVNSEPTVSVMFVSSNGYLTKQVNIHVRLIIIVYDDIYIPDVQQCINSTEETIMCDLL